MNAVVAVIGEGDLAGRVVRALTSCCDIVRAAHLRAGVPAAARLILVLHDAWHPAAHREAEFTLRAAGVPWLRGFAAFGEGVLGPLVRPERSGCSQCADARRLIGGRDRRETWKLMQRFTETGGPQRDVWASDSALQHMAVLLSEETNRILRGEKSRWEERLMLMNLKTLQLSSHRFLPNPLCPACGRLPEDSPEKAIISLQPSPKSSDSSYRGRSLLSFKDALLNDYLDYRVGFINGKMCDLVSPFADVSVNLPTFERDEATAGRTHNYADSELAAILEGLERYCGMAPRGKRSSVRDSYRNVADRALNPVRVGLYSEAQYALPDFPFKPFDPDLVMDWVWGYSFLSEKPLLIPQSLAYYTSGCKEGFVYETSNGCALGGSLEEAVFYGIMEVIERDAFLLAWYAKLPLPRLDPSSAKDPELDIMIDRLRAVAGFDVYLFDATMEHGVPGIWALGRNRKPNGMRLVCAAGAHPDPIRAAKGAIHELSGMMLTLDEKLERNRERAERMLQDPSHVRGMEDHSLLYGLPQTEERMQFLLEGDRPPQSFRDRPKIPAEQMDLTVELQGLLQRFRQLGLEVIVVDQTAPELRGNGLHCVKVLIPGMLPMTFGYRFTRLAGLERVLTVPAMLGYASRPLTAEQLNPHPHPFP